MWHIFCVEIIFENEYTQGSFFIDLKSRIKDMSYDYISEKSCRSDKIKLMSVKQVALCSGMYLEFINHYGTS